MSRGRKAEVGTTKISPNGYHYTRTQSGWELTGRVIGAMKLGRALKPNERVRFLDGNRLNLDPENIEVRKVSIVTDKRKANLEIKIQELQAQLAELEET